MKNFFIVFCINFYTAKITALVVKNVTNISGKSTKIEGSFLLKTILIYLHYKYKKFIKKDIGGTIFYYLCQIVNNLKSE